MAGRLQLRRDNESNWENLNPTLTAGEVAIVLDTTPMRIKIGNGTTPWNDLSYTFGINISTATVNSSGHLIITLTDGTVIDAGYAKGDTGATGAAGTNGTDGTAATISVGTVTTGAAGTSASVENSGTSSAAILNFTIPKGADGTGTGDMSKATYDTANRGYVDKAVTIDDITIDQSIADTVANTGTPIQLLSWIVKEIKSIKGTVTNWYDAAAVSLSTLWGLKDNKQIVLVNAGTGAKARMCWDRNRLLESITVYPLTAPSSSTALAFTNNSTLLTTINTSAATPTTTTVNANVTAGQYLDIDVTGTGISACTVLVILVVSNR